MLFMLAILFSTVAQAAQIDTAVTSVTMEGGLAQVKSQYVIVSQGVEDLAIHVPSDVREVYADMDDQLRTCKIENGTAHCGSTKASKHVFTLAYESEAVIGVLDDREVFKFSEELPFRTSEYTFVLKLPVGSVIARELGKDEFFFVTPKPSEVLSDGQRIIVTWKSDEVSRFSVSAVTEPLREDDPRGLYIGLTVAAVAGAGVTYAVLRKRWKKPANGHVKNGGARKTAKKKEKKEEEVKASVESVPALKAIAPQFVEEEQKVVELLKNAENHELWQKQLLQETGLSKVKLSRLLRNLEERGVVTKQIFGNTNKIALKKEG